MSSPESLVGQTGPGTVDEHTRRQSRRGQSQRAEAGDGRVCGWGAGGSAARAISNGRRAGILSAKFLDCLVKQMLRLGYLLYLDLRTGRLDCVRHNHLPLGSRSLAILNTPQ